LDWTGRLPRIARELASLPARSAALDGEVVALTPGGISDFEALEDALGNGVETDLFYFVFDLLYLDGVDLRERPLLERKQRLQTLVEPGTESPHVRYSGHVEGSGDAFFRRACDLGLEGSISKRKNAPYRYGRGPDWVKVKCRRRRDFVIGGFTDSTSVPGGFGALLLGIPEGPGLVFAGRVGTGFSTKAQEELRGRLARLERPDSPFVTALTLEEQRGVHWVEPRLAVEVSYSNWTRDRRLRHPSFEGLREPGLPPTPPAERRE
jgi:bifunctional non-homologous end joining protein LigD